MGEVGTANVVVELRLELVRKGTGGLAGIGLEFYYSYAGADLMVAVPVLRRW
jgi:hypothetical protein